MKNTRLVALGVASLLAVSACGNTDNAASPSGNSDPTGRTFVSSNITVGGQPMQPAKGTQLSLTFTEGGISAHAGCNTMGGRGSVQDGVLVIDGELSMTEMGCAPERMEQEQRFADLLTAQPTVEFNGTNLTLTSESTVVVMAQEVMRDIVSSTPG